MRAAATYMLVPVLATCAVLATATPLFGQHDHRHQGAHQTSKVDTVAVAQTNASGSAAGDQPSVADSAAADFVRKARAGTVRFRELEKAIEAGYRLVGPDFPGMGEHWVNIRLAMAKRVEPAQPAVLSYLRVDGEAVLTGAAFAVPLRPGEAPPVLPFPVTWHQHGGTIADETLHLNPHAMEAVPDRPQLAMIHAWVWTENPAGTFAQQNWALPFHRLGLEAPKGVTPPAGKAAHLASGGVAYYAGVIERAGRPSPAEQDVAREVLERHREKVLEALAAWSSGRVDSGEVVERLAGLWKNLWEDLLQKLEPEVAERLRSLAG